MTAPHNGARSPSQAVRHGISDLAHDVMTMAELQVKLIRVDLNEGVSRLVAPFVMGIVGIAALLASLPVLLLAMSALLQEFAGMSPSLSLLLASGIGLAVAALLMGIAVAAFRRSFPMLERSRTELTYNLEWMKHMLSRHRHTTPDR